MQPEPSRPARSAEAAVFLAVAVFAGLFAHFHWSLSIFHPPATLERLVAFTAETPYQYRVLVPALLRGLDASGVLGLLGASLESAARTLEAEAVVGLFYALRALLARFVPGPWAPTRWAALGLYALPFLYVFPRFWPYWYPGDVPAVLFMALGLVWMRDQRWAAYYWLFPFATLNRESTALLIAIFALTQFGRLRPVPLALHLAAQLAIWGVFKVLLAYTFKRNEGVGAVYDGALAYNWSLAGEPLRWATLATAFGFLWVPLVVLARHVQDRFVRRALAVVPLFVASCFVVAQFDELRVYGELLPLVLLGVACGAVGRRARRTASPATAPSAP
jgi:hypothetical protein